MTEADQPTREDLARQWTELVKAEAKRCGHALLAILHCKRSHPELWSAVHEPSKAAPAQQQQFEWQDETPPA